MPSSKPASPSSSEATLALSPTPRRLRDSALTSAMVPHQKKIHRSNAQCLSPEKTPKLSSKVASPKKVQTPSPVSKSKCPSTPMKSMKVIKTCVKVGVKSASSSSTGKVVQKSGKKVMKKLVSTFAQKARLARLRSRKDAGERVRTKIDEEWRDLVGYNRSFRCRPPCSYKKFPSKSLSTGMCFGSHHLLFPSYSSSLYFSL